MNPAGKDVADILAAGNLGLTFKTNLFVGMEPPTPDNTVTIFDTPGAGPQLTFDRDERYDYPTIQIRVRNQNYLDGYTMIHNIKILLHGLSHETWNGTTYELIKCMQDPFILDYDANGLPRFVCNFEIQRK